MLCVLVGEASDEVGTARVALAVCLVSRCLALVVFIVEWHPPIMQLLNDVLVATESSRVSNSCVTASDTIQCTTQTVQHAKSGQLAVAGSIVDRPDAIAVTTIQITSILLEQLQTRNETYSSSAVGSWSME